MTSDEMSDAAEQEYLRGRYAARVTEQARDRPGYRAAWASLCAAVLAHGGCLVVPPLDPEPRVDELAAGGVLRPGQARLVAGEPCQCHANAAELWVREEVATIETGYALSGDGLWRQHTWAVEATGQVVETTEARDLYFGVALDDAAALLFAAANLPEDACAAALLRPGRFATVARELLRTHRP